MPWLRLIELGDRFIAFGNDPDKRPARHRDAFVRPDEPEPLPGGGHQHLFQHPPGWRKDAAVGKTLGPSHDRSRRPSWAARWAEVPVGFKFFVDGLLDGSFGFGGEESAGGLPPWRAAPCGPRTRTA